MRVGSDMSYTVNPLNEKDSERLDQAFGIKDVLVEFNPGKCLLPPYHDRIQQQILDAPVRKDDVWLISYPRTGSTWCQEMIWTIGNDLDFDKARNTLQQIRAPLIESSTVLVEFDMDLINPLVANSVDYVNSMSSPRYIKTHLPLGLLPKQLETVKPKIIYTCRNPKDMCVSYYHHSSMVHHLNVDFEEFADLLMKGLAPFGPVFPHYLDMWKKRHEPNILVLRYEDMNRDLKGTLKKIAAFLDKEYTEAEYDKLCEFLSFKQMRENKGCNLETVIEDKMGKDFYKRIGHHFIRKGVIGDWKNHMSPELSKRFDEWIEENTRGTGLSFD